MLWTVTCSDSGETAANDVLKEANVQFGDMPDMDDPSLLPEKNARRPSNVGSADLRIVEE